MKLRNKETLAIVLFFLVISGLSLMMFFSSSKVTNHTNLAQQGKQQVASSDSTSEQAKTALQQDSSTNQDNVQHFAASTRKAFSSNFTYTHNKDLSIGINGVAESLEREAIKQWDPILSQDDSRWDTSSSGNLYAKTFENFYSLHPVISGSVSIAQILTFKIKANVPFDKSSVDELQRLFDSVMMLNGYIYPKMSTIVAVSDPQGNKVYYAVHEMGNGYSTAILSENDVTVWQVLMGQNASETMMEDGAKKFKRAGQDLYNVFHGSISQSQSSVQPSTNSNTLPSTREVINVPPQTPAPITTIALPNVIGKTLKEARNILERQDNIVMTVDGNDTTVNPADMIVVDISPRVGTQVHPNGRDVQADIVNITVSRSITPSQTPTQTVTIVQPNVLPNVIGKTLEEAINILKRDNVIPETTYVDTVPGPAGIVVSMSPKAGEQPILTGGSVQVFLTVSGSPGPSK